MGEHRRYKVTDDRFGRLALTLRERAGLTQAEVADALGVSERSIRQWETGMAFPSADNLKKLIAIYLQYGAFAPGRERDEAHALWQQVAETASRHKGFFDDAWFDDLLRQPRYPLARSTRYASARRSTESPPLLRRADWGAAPEAAVVYGRERDLDTLAQWVLTDYCRVVAVLGMGGIGKTTLVIRCAQTVAPQFAFVLWRSLRNAPPLEELLADCLLTLAGQSSPTVPHSIETLLALLIELLRHRRCLLILDNVDTLLEAGSLEGRYRAGYEAYRLLFQRLAETAHQSCVLLTSREMLSELEPSASPHAAVRALKLSGLARAASQELLSDKDLFGAPEVWGAFVHHYAGNPLALKIAAVTVHDLFGGDIAVFLRQGPVTLHTLVQLLDDQFERLSPAERDVLIWLAIERDLVALEELSANFVGAMAKKDWLSALKSLRRRSLVERGEQDLTFMLQPVVMEYVSDWLVAQLSDEIIRANVELLARYALIKGQSKDYIRESQIRMLVQPVLNNLLAHFGDRQHVTAHLRLLVQQLRALPAARQGYAGGNLVNLVVGLQGDIRGWDFSQQVLRQAYLQGVEAQDASFAGADVRETLFMEPLETIAAMTLSPDGRYLAVGSFSGQIRVWQVADSTLLWTSKGHSRMAWAVAFSPDATLLASGGYGGRVKVWDVISGRRLKTLQGHRTWVRAVAFHPNGNILASAGDDATLRVWDIRDGTHRHVLQGHVGLVWSVAFSPDGALLASGGSDGTIRIWNVQAGTCLRTLQHPHGVFTVAFHPGGALLASGGEEGQIMLWDIHSGDCLTALHRHMSGTAPIAFNPEGTLLASGSNQGVVELWQIEGQRNRRHVGTLRGHRWLVSAVSFAPHGLLASVAYGGQVRLWDARSGRLLKTIQGYSRLMSALAFSPDGGLLAQGDDNGVVRVWDLSSGRCLAAMQGHVGPVWTISWRSDGMSFASGGDDREVKLWEARTGRLLKSFGGHTVVIWALAFSPDGALLASGGADKVIRLWPLAREGEEDQLVTLEGSIDMIMSLAFSGDGGLLASGHLNGEIKLWDTSILRPSSGQAAHSAGVASGQCLHTMQHYASPVGALYVNADGKTLISSSNHGALKWWDVASEQCVETLPADVVGNWVKAVAFSADGALLATGSADQSVQLWRVDENAAQQPMIFSGHVGQVWAVALSSDHRTLASSDDEGMTIIWDTHSGAIVRRLVSDRPYERMNISGIKGLSEAQRAALKALGAVEEAVE
jgi:WD40 repeat protein/transcriptional regulator with XRE-family HTH domain